MICDCYVLIFQLGVMVMVYGIVLKWRLAPKHTDVCSQLCFSHPDTHNLHTSLLSGCDQLSLTEV